MFHHPAWAVGNYSSGLSAGGTLQIEVNPTNVTDRHCHPVVQISTRSSLTTNSHLYRILTLPQFTSEELSSVKETDVTPQLRDGSHDDDVMLAGDDGEGLLN